MNWSDTAAGPGDDDLYPARLHRFAFAPKLALAELCGEDRGALLAVLVESWRDFAQSGASHLPYLSNLSVAQRFVALSWTWAFLAARPESTILDGFRLEFEILRVLWADAQFLVPRLGDSYPNNHLLADGFIGWYMATLFPEFMPHPEQGAKWECLWLRELERQIYEDGTSFEHCAHYHEFACEMAVAYILLSRLNDRPVPDWVAERTRRMLDFQTAVGGPGGIPVHLGDATDDPFFPLEGDESWATGGMRELNRALFDAAIPPTPVTAPGVATAFWLLGGRLAPSGDATEEVPGEASSHIAFEDGGYHVFHDDALRAQLMFRSGPSPQVPVFGGHMHADLMSVYVSLQDAPMIVDSGTYTYKDAVNWPADSPEWRRYLMGPGAHNGLAIGEADPLGPVPGNFRPQNIRTKVDTRSQSCPAVAARVESTMLDAGVYDGWRRGVVSIPGQYWVIYDMVSGHQNQGEASFGFQFARNVDIARLPDSGLAADLEHDALLIVHSQALKDPEILSGRHDPIGGWVSSSYGRIDPAPQARYSLRTPGNGPQSTSAFLLKPLRNRPDSTHMHIGNEREGAFRIATPEGTDYLILPPFDSSSTREILGIRFTGNLMWLRTIDDMPVALRCLGLNSLSAPAWGFDITTSETITALAVSLGAEGPEIEYNTGGTPQIAFDTAKI